MINFYRPYTVLPGLLLCCFLLYVSKAEANVNVPAPVPKVSSSSASSFIENKGQIVDQYQQHRTDIQYTTSVPGINIFIGNGQIHYQWTKASNSSPQSQNGLTGEAESLFDIYRMDVSLVGANVHATVKAEEIQDDRINYYLSQCSAGVTAKTCKKITYKNVYPNIDWVLYIKENQNSEANNAELKYDFIVYPGGNASDIQLKYEGTTALNIKDGALIATTPFGSITENAPYAYDAATKEVVDVDFSIEDDVVGFVNAEHNGTLVIDPLVNIVTYYGGTFYDYGYAVTTDGAGYVYMSGKTNSLYTLASSGPHQMTVSGDYDAYIVCFLNSGGRHWATYYGGADMDAFYSVACDRLGNVYAGGITKSDTGIASNGSHQAIYGGLPLAGTSGDGMLVKFNDTGGREWGTYYGGSGVDELRGVTVFRDTCIYVTGYTNSFNNIGTPGRYHPNLNDYSSFGIDDAFLVRFNSAGNRRWGTYFGGQGNETSYGLVTDYSGNIYIAGTTYSSTGIATTGSHQENRAGADTTTDAFLAKFNPQGTAVVWATYYGGNGDEQGTSVAYDPMGYVYLAGNTISANNIATPGTHQTSILGVGYDGFAVKFDLGGQRQWGTYYGGPGADYIYGAAVSSVNQLYIYGQTQSNTSIATAGSYKSLTNGPDMFFARFSMSGKRQMGSYFGGEGWEEGQIGVGTAIHCANGYIYFTGSTRSQTGISNSAVNYTIWQKEHGSPNAGGNWTDGFLAVFEDDPPKPIEIIGPFTDTVLCPGDKFAVSYDLNSQTFHFPNSFEVWLSDPLGNFNSLSVKIGSKQTWQPGTIDCTIPDTTKPGSKYRVRIRGTMPQALPSDDNGIDIRIKPSPGAVNISSNAPVCEGDSLLLYSNNSNPGITYEWTGPQTFTSATKDAFVAKSLQGNQGKYVVTAILDGCKTRDTDSITIKPAPRLQSIGSNSPICEGYVLSLYTNDSAKGVTYAWTGPDAFKSALKNPQINNSKLSSEGMYTVVASIGSCIKKASTYITVKQHPGLVDITTNGPVCDGEDLNFQVIDTLNIGNYLWAGPAGFKSTAKAPVVNKIQTTGAGLYILTVEHEGCFAKDSVKVEIKPVPEIEIQATGEVKAGDTIFLNVVSDMAATYSWSGPNFFSSTELNPYVYPAAYIAEGVYEVAAEVNGCFATASVTIKVRIPEEDIFVLFPNPNKGNFTIKGDVRSDTRIGLEVIDEIGRIVFTGRILPKNNKVNANISLPGYLSNGVYYLILRTGNSKKSISFTLNK